MFHSLLTLCLSLAIYRNTIQTRVFSIMELFNWHFFNYWSIFVTKIHTIKPYIFFLKYVWSLTYFIQYILQCQSPCSVRFIVIITTIQDDSLVNTSIITTIIIASAILATGTSDRLFHTMSLWHFTEYKRN